jgi:hypothetical protein
MPKAGSGAAGAAVSYRGSDKKVELLYWRRLLGGTMRRRGFGTAAAALAAAAAIAPLAGCRGAKPILPRRPLPSGTFQVQFTSRLRGPLELTINGSRVPVEQRKKRARTLTVSGLPVGTHRYFFFCPAEVVGPDLGEIEMGPDGGVFQVHFSQRLRVAYPEPAQEAAPGAWGAGGGIAAVLE